MVGESFLGMYTNSDIRQTQVATLSMRCKSFKGLTSSHHWINILIYLCKMLMRHKRALKDLETLDRDFTDIWR